MMVAREPLQMPAVAAVALVLLDKMRHRMLVEMVARA
jgi:hypothetical protein